MIEVAFAHRQGDFALDVSFASEARLVALFGPSGAGKTTVLNVIAGLIRPARARVIVGGRTLTDTQSGALVPPHRRRIGYVFGSSQVRCRRAVNSGDRLRARPQLSCKF